MAINGFDSTTLLQRMVDAVEAVRTRLLKACRALENAGVNYGVVGDNAVAAWVASIDEGAVRNSRDVEVMIRRQDFDAAKRAFESEGFVHRRVAGVEMFLDHADAKARTAVHVIYSDEYVRAGEPSPNPGIEDAMQIGAIRVLNLEALVRIKLTAFRDKDKTHIRDLIDVGLVDQSWTSKLPSVLGDRLQSLLDTPDG